MRLGYGGGFYDITLRKLKEEKPVFAVGIGFADQWCDDLPTSADDVAVDAVVTEQGLFAN
jgi:5-formyltetrahydrofolate cyclo-ligase